MWEHAGVRRRRLALTVRQVGDGNEWLLRNVLTLTHFGVNNQSLSDRPPPQPQPHTHTHTGSSVIANAVHVTGACQFRLLFIDSSSEGGRGEVEGGVGEGWRDGGRGGGGFDHNYHFL